MTEPYNVTRSALLGHSIMFLGLGILSKVLTNCIVLRTKYEQLSITYFYFLRAHPHVSQICDKVFPEKSRSAHQGC